LGCYATATAICRMQDYRSAWKALSEGTIDIRRMLCGLRAKVLESGQSERINYGAE